MSFDKPILYSFYRSSCAHRVRIALNYKNIPYDIIPINLEAGQQNDNEYINLNPLAVVPALLIDKIVLTQSIAIIEFLEEKFPDPHILPNDLYKRAQVRSLVGVIASDTQPLVAPRVAVYSGMDRQEWAKHFIELGLNGFEHIINKTAGKFCVGNDITMADIVLVPQVKSAERFDVDVSAYPKIMEIVKNLEEIEAFKKASPESQVDFPGNRN